MEFNFKKSLAQVKMVRLNQDDAILIEKIAKENGVEQSEVIRTFVHEAVKEYLKQPK